MSFERRVTSNHSHYRRRGVIQNFINLISLRVFLTAIVLSYLSFSLSVTLPTPPARTQHSNNTFPFELSYNSHLIPPPSTSPTLLNIFGISFAGASAQPSDSVPYSYLVRENAYVWIDTVMSPSYVSDATSFSLLDLLTFSSMCGAKFSADLYFGPDVYINPAASNFIIYSVCVANCQSAATKVTITRKVPAAVTIMERTSSYSRIQIEVTVAMNADLQNKSAAYVATWSSLPTSKVALGSFELRQIGVQLDVQSGHVFSEYVQVISLSASITPISGWQGLHASSTKLTGRQCLAYCRGFNAFGDGWVVEPTASVNSMLVNENALRGKESFHLFMLYTGKHNTGLVWPSDVTQSTQVARCYGNACGIATCLPSAQSLAYCSFPSAGAGGSAYDPTSQPYSHFILKGSGLSTWEADVSYDTLHECMCSATGTCYSADLLQNGLRNIAYLAPQSWVRAVTDSASGSVTYTGSRSETLSLTQSLSMSSTPSRATTSNFMSATGSLSISLTSSTSLSVTKTGTQTDSQSQSASSGVASTVSPTGTIVKTLTSGVSRTMRYIASATLGGTITGSADMSVSQTTRGTLTSRPVMSVTLPTYSASEAFIQSPSHQGPRSHTMSIQASLSATMYANDSTPSGTSSISLPHTSTGSAKESSIFMPHTISIPKSSTFSRKKNISSTVLIPATVKEPGMSDVFVFILSFRVRKSDIYNGWPIMIDAISTIAGIEAEDVVLISAVEVSEHVTAVEIHLSNLSDENAIILAKAVRGETSALSVTFNAIVATFKIHRITGKKSLQYALAVMILLTIGITAVLIMVGIYCLLRQKRDEAKHQNNVQRALKYSDDNAWNATQGIRLEKPSLHSIFSSPMDKTLLKESLLGSFVSPAENMFSVVGGRLMLCGETLWNAKSKRGGRKRTSSITFLGKPLKPKKKGKKDRKPEASQDGSSDHSRIVSDQESDFSNQNRDQILSMDGCSEDLVRTAAELIVGDLATGKGFTPESVAHQPQSPVLQPSMRQHEDLSPMASCLPGFRQANQGMRAVPGSGSGSGGLGGPASVLALRFAHIHGNDTSASDSRPNAGIVEASPKLSQCLHRPTQDPHYIQGSSTSGSEVSTNRNSVIHVRPNLATPQSHFVLPVGAQLFGNRNRSSVSAPTPASSPPRRDSQQYNFIAKPSPRSTWAPPSASTDNTKTDSNSATSDGEDIFVGTNSYDSGVLFASRTEPTQQTSSDGHQKASRVQAANKLWDVEKRPRQQRLLEANALWASFPTKSSEPTLTASDTDSSDDDAHSDANNNGNKADLVLDSAPRTSLAIADQILSPADRNLLHSNLPQHQPMLFVSSNSTATSSSSASMTPDISNPLGLLANTPTPPSVALSQPPPATEMSKSKLKRESKRKKEKDREASVSTSTIEAKGNRSLTKRVTLSDNVTIVLIHNHTGPEAVDFGSLPPSPSILSVRNGEGTHNNSISSTPLKTETLIIQNLEYHT